MRGRQWVVATMLVVAAAAPADTLTLKDGKTYEGKLVSRTPDKVVFEVQKSGMSYTSEFRPSEVESITQAADKAGGKTESKADATPSAGGTKRSGTSKPSLTARFSLPSPPPPPPVAPAPAKSYYVIPLAGEVGKTFNAQLLEQSLADAAKRKPTVVVLEVDSPGGMIQEVEKCVNVLREYRKSLHIVAFVKHAYSAAAVTVLSCREIYMDPGASIGAALAFRITPEGTPADISEKMQSVWRAHARTCAELGGYDSLLAEGMVDQGLLVVMDANGCLKSTAKDIRHSGQHVTVIVEAKEKIIKMPGKLLTLTPDEAIACKICKAKVETYDELGEKLDLKGWTECVGYSRPLAEYWVQAVKAVTEAGKSLDNDFKNAMTQAKEHDPSQFQYMVFKNGTFTNESKLKWQTHTGACVRFLEKAEAILADYSKLGEMYPGLVFDPELVKDYAKEIKAIRDHIARGADRSGVH